METIKYLLCKQKAKANLVTPHLVVNNGSQYLDAKEPTYTLNGLGINYTDRNAGNKV